MLMTATDECVLGAISQEKALLGFSNRNLSVAARNLEVGGVTPPCLKKHVKPLVLRLISPRSCQFAVPSHYEREGIGSAPVFAHTLVHYISCVLRPYYLLVKEDTKKKQNGFFNSIGKPSCL